MKKSIKSKSQIYLNSVVISWFSVAVVSQIIFATYVILFYGKATLSGHSEYWNKILPHGYVNGEVIGNLVVGLHLFLAAVIIVGGPLQLITKIRNRFRKFHRWNGRIFIFTAYVLSITGLTMVWGRGAVGGLAQHISISINAILIIIAATMTIFFAVRRNIKIHSSWAIRLYLLVNGVWFFRVGLFFWLFVNNGPYGYDPKTFQGPFLTFLSISQYSIPLILFELYLFAKRKNIAILNYSASFILFLFILIIAIGSYSISTSLWFPMMAE
ncbi:putative membrane protein DUF2306 [Gelidibacter algens]|uniref:Putative membrane protein DUF2306 n=1 Tax=Gelidibacter algens TaxID=49280 RepID=A0A1A7QL25_9FLAO|nr:DUF2306 domain-containing protein [Gelidibacter algens]OBX19317.1 hypothetical protein A9996_18855 [Gelidibacter algens]RAJ25128.1 putative membrane protein DUF2306 [Gelidibacter algens]